MAAVNLVSRNLPQEGALSDSGFDLHALHYERRWERDPVAQALRRAVRSRLRAHVRPGVRVLDIGCGPGADAAWMRSLGAEVLAIDASPGMVAEARRRDPGLDVRVSPAEDVGGLADEGPFDLALMDMGVLNCVDLPAVAFALSGCLRPGGVVVLVPMPRVHPTWMLRELLRGRPSGALGRLRARTAVDVEGEAVPVRYLGGREVREAFGPWFRVVGRRGLGFLLPPPGSALGARLAGPLDRLEAPLRALPGLRALGDHVVLELARREAPPRPAPVPPRLAAALAARTGEVRRVHTLLLEATTGCQSRCVACAYRGPAGGEALTPRVARALAEEAAALGARSVVLTGGEPLLRPDRAALLEALAGTGLPLTLLSNGLSLQRDAALVARTCAEVVLSLDGYDGDSYAAARGVDGFARVRSGVAALRAAAPGLPIRARVTVTGTNAAVLDRIAVAAAELGFDSVSFLAADLSSPDAFGREGAPAAAPAPAAVAASALARARAATREGFVVDSAAAQARVGEKLAADAGEGAHRAPRCNAPYASVFVQADLTVRPCFFLPVVAHAGAGLRPALAAARPALAALDIATDPTCARCVCWADLR